MSPKSPVAARRMMRALSYCDNRQINDAVRRYSLALNDDELIRLLHRSRTGLDPYHSAVLASLLQGMEATDSRRRATVKKIFGSFVAENPRALEQLPAEMIDGILQHAASDDPNLRRQFMPERSRPYITVISGMAGSLLAAIAIITYFHFGASQVNDVALIPPSLPLKTAVVKLSPAVTPIRPPEKRRVGGTSLLTSRHPLSHRGVTNVIPHASIPVARRATTRSGIASAQIAPGTTIAQSAARRHSMSAATLLTVVPQPARRLTTIAKASVASHALPSTVAVDVNVVTETIEPRDVEQSTQTTDGSPARYCYARGTWRAC